MGLEAREHWSAAQLRALPVVMLWQHTTAGWAGHAEGLNKPCSGGEAADCKQVMPEWQQGQALWPAPQ